MRLYEKMMVCSLTPEQHARTCNYWYTVTTEWTAHTAFETKEGLLKWLSDRGLVIEGELPARGVHSVHEIRGSYVDNMMMDWRAFELLKGPHIRQLNNGDYTLGILTRNPENLVTVNFLNPNCRERVIFDHRESNALTR